MEFNHVTVLLNETVDSINVKEGGIYADFTLGGGGHTSLILERGGHVIGIDRDITAIKNAEERFKGQNFTSVHDNFSNIKNIARNLGIEKFDGIIADLGVSSPQLDDASRGFSYMQDAPLDMRMDNRDSLTAKDVVNTYSSEELFRIISTYGEERWASRIVNFIVEHREKVSIETTYELVDIIKAAIPLSARKDGPHPAKRTFQAIRIEVNSELENLEPAIDAFFSRLKKGGRLAIITFHSLEDRIVKNTFKKYCAGCTCPDSFPVCVCGGKPKGVLVNRKAIVADLEETESNPRSKCAKLRCIEKL